MSARRFFQPCFGGFMTAIVQSTPQPFSRADYKTLGLAALGGALEIYDFIIFVFFALTLSQLFFPPDMPEWLRLLQSFGIFVTGYLARPLGGILMAHFADRLGRKRVFSLSILMMALPCLLIGIMPTYAQIGYWAPLVLLALRILQGAAVGGEVPSAWVFVAEHAPQGHRGYALGVLQAGLTFGYLLGALTATWLARVFSPGEILDWAWRIPFLLGGVFGVVGVWLRRWLNETPVFIAMHAQRENLPALPLGQVLRDHRQSLLPAALLTFVLTSAVVVLVVITPTVMQQRFGISASNTFALSAVGIVFLNIGCVLAGMLVDRIGAWRGVIIYSLLLPLGIGVLYASLIQQWMPLSIAYAIEGLACGVVGVVPSVMVGLFPANIRVSGISFTYNIAYAFWASTTPLLLIALMPWNIWVCVLYSLVMGIVGLTTAAVFGLRRGVVVDDLATGRSG
ncbi:Major facilitator family transporter [Pseudomonas savastanoi pv. glycinea]|uniref:Major facilitator family transporter n=3 Tax=Pseudomonas savastanoi pv. glycinea TaxID=318 RepID=A0A3M5V9H9_PSESG|nr:Major facilitator family transporter [Pseudomonas savastanoi pv. glycinea]RMM66644.1 Major facilitator family transporter [Pseudomonas savastanoi pv. glycinea]RMM89697.1 Permease of the major facilitator superfamily [Pseudomonas savastanoi pv. glycinea]RMM91203.1 Major facilitator family transporter [Pseudomonas savastanoi pv. glycinea]RMO36676.1 Major facilitator family transporter [Pseudomonas savastanoi pv. glycinea]